MKKSVLVIFSLLNVAVAFAGQGDQYFSLNGGFLFNSTLNATLGYERELSYTDAFEVFAEAGNRWEKDPVCGKVCTESFWSNYYWAGGVAYKKCLKRMKNSTFRLRLGPQMGAVNGNFFMALECGFEYNYVLPNRVQLTVTQKNQVGFLHGDTFRNGLLVGLKIPF